ncbi:ABC transporter substrate-binding protein [Planococcus lenghuensis]|uniref:ABC transporter substrate-binding protein n=1 Tax=Planococcus lenghuensis TaxID=2213202 RepID=A0A1Q2KWE2_9BACL|nr:ABC transporter substrate-binding protein [Planococcus lenghuensis]AQQ52127.1 ABC transporter substrate-binding protein [Planococcus lenghuensis]
MKAWQKTGLTMTSALLVLSGCGGFSTSNESEEEVALEEEGVEIVDFWTFWGSETRRPIIDKIVADFNESQDEIEVVHSYYPWGDIWTKELAAIGAGDPPDVVINNINSTRLRAQEEQAENLTEIMGDNDIADRFYPELWESVLYEGEAYALPFNTDTQILFYNKDAFEEAGLDPEAPPATWAELEEYALTLDEKSGDEYEQIGFYPLWGMGYDVWLLNANGENYIDQEGNVSLNTETNVDVLNWLSAWRDRLGADTVDSFQAKFESNQGHPFLSGELAMMAANMNFYTQIRDYAPDLNFGVAPLPAYEAGAPNTSWGGGFVAEIPKGSDSPEAALEFMKYLTDVEAQTYWAVKNFDIVANIEAAELAAESEELSEDGQMVYETGTENMEYTLQTPVPTMAPDFYTLVNPEVDEFFLGEQSAEEALQNAQDAVENLVEQNQ